MVNIMNGMTEHDWAIWLKDIPDSNRPLPPIEYANTYKFISLGCITHKARFFITDNGIAGIFGFWVPKVGIAVQSENEVQVAKWVNIKIIEFK